MRWDAVDRHCIAIYKKEDPYPPGIKIFFFCQVIGFLEDSLMILQEKLALLPVHTQGRDFLTDGFCCSFIRCSCLNRAYGNTSHTGDAGPVGGQVGCFFRDGAYRTLQGAAGAEDAEVFGPCPER